MRPIVLGEPLEVPMRYALLFGLMLGCGGTGAGSGSGGSPGGGPIPLAGETPPAVPANGTTYYVSPTGSDSNAGTQAAPWRTPGYGSRQLSAGDTLVILGGTYNLTVFDADILAPGVGASDNWIVIRGQDGNRPVLRAGNNLLCAVDLSGSRYVKIANLEITNLGGQPFRDGIEALGAPARNILLQDLDVHHLDEFGVNVGDAQDFQIWNSTIRYCGLGSVGGPAGTQGGWKNVLLSGCTLSYSGHYFQGGPGPSPYDRPDGFGIEPSNGPIEIRKTVAEHNFGDGLDSKASNTWIHECVVANNSCDGVKLWGGGSKVENTLIYGRGDGNNQTTPWAPIVIGTEQSGATFEFVNVTADDVVGYNTVLVAQYDWPNTPVSLTLRNCIFSGRGPDSAIWIAASATTAISSCLFYMPQSSNVLVKGATSYTSAQVGQLGPGNLYGDPLFVGGENYHLQTGSPAIDAGSAQAPATDLDGKVRPQGAGVDIGAYDR